MHGAHRHDFTDVSAWVERFEAPERAVWQKPAEVIASLNIARGDRVADIGAGTGYFTIALARAAGDKGVAYAVDSEPGMLKHLGKRVEKERAPKVKTVLARGHDPALPEPVDLIFICNVLHHVEHRKKYLAALRASLRPHGRVAIIDWQKRAPKGPPKEMRIGAAQMIEEMRAAGFSVVERHGFLPYQYFLVFAGSINAK